MAAEWRFEGKLDKLGATRVCIRVYEELDEFLEEIQDTGGDGAHDALEAIRQMRDRLQLVLPLDPEVTV